MHYTYDKTPLTSYDGFCYSLKDEKGRLTYQQVIDNWQVNADFVTFFHAIIAESEFPAFYWEVKPITVKQLNQFFEFVIINSKILKNMEADIKPFRHHFTTIKSVVTFPNLGKDAQLIVPCPLVDLEHYGHLASFARNAPKSQCIAFWKLVGELFNESLGPKPKWLSTAGLGVSWLHIRIDSKPKYYRYKPYHQLDNQ